VFPKLLAFTDKGQSKWLQSHHSQNSDAPPQKITEEMEKEHSSKKLCVGDLLSGSPAL
jgi:hypothetical protein